MAAIGILHPGAMGATVAGILARAGHEVLWAADGRSDATRARATAAGLVAVADLSTLTARVEAVVSVCPPAAAVDVAAAVVDAGFRGRFVDANAVAPATARRIAEVVTGAGGTFVDGGIVGPPPHEPGTTRLYLSGEHAAAVAAWFAAGPLEARVVDGPPGAASAVKAGFAGWTKGSAALLLAVRALARAEGVEDALLDEWRTSLPDVADRSTRVAATIHRKAWRFAGEMEEIAAALAAAGLPPGLHAAAADLYGRLADLKDRPDDQDPGEVLDRLAGEDGDARP